MMEIVKNKEEVKSVMNIIQAFADGKTIQAIDPYDDEWVDQTGLNFKALFERQYRIKPEQKYRPFKDAKECWNEMQKHQPFGWVINISNGRAYNIQSVLLEDGVLYIRSSYVELGRAFIDYTFADGTPFGTK